MNHKGQIGREIIPRGWDDKKKFAVKKIKIIGKNFGRAAAKAKSCVIEMWHHVKIDMRMYDTKDQTY